jgi:hypothetical protein
MLAVTAPLPGAVESALAEAAQRTGRTEALYRASEQLALIFTMTASEFEQYTKDIYSTIV